MSLLDEVKIRLLESACSAENASGDQLAVDMDDVRWIVQALEAAERVQFTPREDSCNWTCETCGASTTEWGDGEPFPHRLSCPWQALVAALQGEAVSSPALGD